MHIVAQSKSDFLFNHRFMNLKDSHDVRHYLLFLENETEGKGKNLYSLLMRDLCKIYAQSIEESFDYLPSAVARTSTFVSSYYSIFWAKYAHKKDELVRCRTEITSFIATQIAMSALDEFKLGNVY